MNYVTKEEFGKLIKRVENLEGVEAPIGQCLKKPQTIQEFLRSAKPKSEVDKAIHLIYFHEIREGNDGGVKSSDLREMFQKAREKMPNNLPDVLGRCAKRKLISEKSRKGRIINWQITNAGIDYVEKSNDN